MTNSKFYNPATAPYLDPKTNRQVVLITGANSGIGWFTVLHLYLHGYIVYIVGRTESKVQKAIEEIKAEAEKRNAEKESWLGELHFLYADLLDLSTVVKVAEEFSAKEPKLHILINNAGLMGVPYEVTKDDYEIQYQVNFVGHFLLTQKLLPNLQAVADEGKIQPRVINLSSVGHSFAYKYFDPTDKIKKAPNGLFTWVRYGVAKAASIHFAKEFGELHPDILSVAVHPGVVVGTELYNHWKSIPVVGFFAKGFFKFSDVVLGVSNEEGALATLKVALDPDVTAEKNNGNYYVTGGVLATPSSVASNETYIKKTWDINVKELKARALL